MITKEGIVTISAEKIDFEDFDIVDADNPNREVVEWAIEKLALTLMEMDGAEGTVH